MLGHGLVFLQPVQGSMLFAGRVAVWVLQKGREVKVRLRFMGGVTVLLWPLGRRDGKNRGQIREDDEEVQRKKKFGGDRHLVTTAN